jgi:uncharacterized protein YndB with AHSA1/START domain
MVEPGILHVAAEGDREIVITRAFHARRSLLFDAHTRPELVRRWLGVHAGWAMVVCEIDLRAGGTYRYLWHKELDGETVYMGMVGIYREVTPPVRTVASELFDDPWYPGECIVTMSLSETDSLTALALSLSYETPEARDLVLRTPLHVGLRESYDALDRVLDEVQSGSEKRT